MKIKDIQKEERKTISINLRTFPAYSKWMKDNKISPTKAFNESIKELMTKK